MALSLLADMLTIRIVAAEERAQGFQGYVGQPDEQQVGLSSCSWAVEGMGLRLNLSFTTKRADQLD